VFNYCKVTHNIFWHVIIKFAQLREQNQQSISGCETRWFFFGTKNSLPSPLVVHNM